MAFMDTITGAPAAFASELDKALRTLDFSPLKPKTRMRLHAFAGVGFLLNVKKVLRHNVDYKDTGSMSMRVSTVDHGEVYVQAVHDKYASRFPVPWVIAAERFDLKDRLTKDLVQRVIRNDIEIARALYGDGKVPDEVSVKYTTNQAHQTVVQELAKLGTTISPLLLEPDGRAITAHVMQDDSSVSPMMRVRVDYRQFCKPKDDEDDEKVEIKSPVDGVAEMKEMLKRKKAGKPTTLAEAMELRKRQAKMKLSE